MLFSLSDDDGENAEEAFPEIIYYFPINEIAFSGYTLIMKRPCSWYISCNSVITIYIDCRIDRLSYENRVVVVTVTRIYKIRNRI